MNPSLRAALVVASLLTQACSSDDVPTQGADAGAPDGAAARDAGAVPPSPVDAGASADASARADAAIDAGADAGADAAPDAAGVALPAGTAVVAGPFEGHSLAGVTVALSDVAQVVAPRPGSGTKLQIVLSSDGPESTACGDVSTGVHASTILLHFELFNYVDPTTLSYAAPTAPATFQLEPQQGVFTDQADADILVLDSTCQTVEQVIFSEGTVTLTSLTATSAAGSFSLDTGGGAPLTGSFTTAACPGILSLDTPPQGTSCNP